MTAAMDPQTAIDDVEKFLAAWNANCMQHLGGVIAQAGFDRDTPLLTTTHLQALLDALHAARRDAPAKPCTSHAHREFVGDQTVPCALPAGHEFHRNGAREWMP